MTAQTKTTTKTSGKIALAALISTLAIGGAATNANAAVTTCNSSGGRQEAGALIGAVVGGVIGNNVAKNERGLGTVAGAGLGAAAGSMIGCNQQDKRAADERARYGYSGKDAWVAHANVNIRSQPTAHSARVGGLQAGQRFQSMGVTRDGQWVIVGQNGRHVGFVSRGYASPV